MIKEIASRLGYWSPYHFSARFKSFFGVSPKQFREHYQQNKRYWSSKAVPANHAIAAKDHRKSESDCCSQNDNTQLLRQESQEPKDLPAGSKIDRFLIINSIGHGGMGVLNRGVALKLIRSERAQSIDSKNRKS